jgi:hypothetical protein
MQFALIAFQLLLLLSIEAVSPSTYLTRDSMLALPAPAAAIAITGIAAAAAAAHLVLSQAAC